MSSRVLFDFIWISHFKWSSGVVCSWEIVNPLTHTHTHRFRLIWKYLTADIVQNRAGSRLVLPVAACVLLNFHVCKCQWSNEMKLYSFQHCSIPFDRISDINFSLSTNESVSICKVFWFLVLLLCFWRGVKNNCWPQKEDLLMTVM